MNGFKIHDALCANDPGLDVSIANPLQVFLPSIMLMILVLSVSFVGDGLRDALDPQSLK